MECAICLENMIEENINPLLFLLPCRHSFHNDCITAWLKKSSTCPLCRSVVYARVDSTSYKIIFSSAKSFNSMCPIINDNFDNRID